MARRRGGLFDAAERAVSRALALVHVEELQDALAEERLPAAAAKAQREYMAHALDTGREEALSEIDARFEPILRDLLDSRARQDLLVRENRELRQEIAELRSDVQALVARLGSQ